MLAALGGFALDPRDVAGPLNTMAFGLTVFVAGQWLRYALRSRLIVLMGCLAIVFSASLVWRASWAYSETVFIALATSALFSASRYMESGRRAALMWAAIFTALASLTRYSGVVLALVVILPLIVRVELIHSGRLRHAGLFLAMALTPLALWLARNFLLTGSLTGPERGTAKGGPLVNHAARGLSSMEAWNPLAVDLRALLLPLDPESGRIVGVLIVGGVLGILGAFVLWGCRHWWVSGRGDRRLVCLVVAGAYAFLHIAFTNANAALGNLTLDARQFVPAYVPLIVVVMAGSDMVLSARHRAETGQPAWRPIIKGRSVLAHTLLIAGIVVWISYSALVILRDTHRAVFSPETAWNSYVYNAEHIAIDAESLRTHLSTLVGDSLPVASEHFDLYLGDHGLIYHRLGCSSDDFSRKMSLRVVPVNPIHLSAERKNFGMEIMSFYPARQGAIHDGECLAVTPLPAYDIDVIITGQQGNGGTAWAVEISP